MEPDVGSIDVPGVQTFSTIALGCFALSALSTWLVRNIARRRGWLALPRVDRWHREPTALFGGVAVYFTFVAGVLVTIPVSRPVIGLLLLTTTMFAVGLVDDARHLGPHTKLAVQLMCGLLLYSAGYHFNDGFPWWADLSIVVFWVVAITNAVNLLDNMNGLAAGIALIAGAFRLLWYRETGNIDGAITSAVFMGSVAGFLMFNYPRASIFMGDAGSFTVGFVLAALNLSNGQVYSKSLFSVLLFPVLVLAIPILDTTFVSVVRYFSGRAISQGGRDHVSHRLVAVGLSDAVAVLLLWAVSTAAGFIAFAMYKVGSRMPGSERRCWRSDWCCSASCSAACACTTKKRCRLRPAPIAVRASGCRRSSATSGRCSGCSWTHRPSCWPSTAPTSCCSGKALNGRGNWGASHE